MRKVKTQDGNRSRPDYSAKPIRHLNGEDKQNVDIGSIYVAQLPRQLNYSNPHSVLSHSASYQDNFLQDEGFIHAPISNNSARFSSGSSSQQQQTMPNRSQTSITPFFERSPLHSSAISSSRSTDNVNLVARFNNLNMRANTASIESKEIKESKEKAEQYLHAFTSLISLESISVCEENTECTTIEEKGWNPGDYWNIHKKIIERLLNSKSALIKDYAKKHLADIEGMIRTDNDKNYLLEIIDSLDKGQNALTTWNTSDHRIYLDAFLDANGTYGASVYNLGAGNQVDFKTKILSPMTYSFSSKEQLKSYMFTLRSVKNAEIKGDATSGFYIDGLNGEKISEDDLYTNFVYRGERVSCEGLCAYEERQTTGNCVVKNLLFFVRQDFMYLYGDDNGQLYKNFYFAMVQASIELSKEYSKKLTVSLLDKGSEFCEAVSRSALNNILGASHEELIYICKTEKEKLDIRNVQRLTI